MRILIVDDDSDITTFLQSRLEEKCFACDTVADGESAIHQANVIRVLIFRHLI